MSAQHAGGLLCIESAVRCSAFILLIDLDRHSIAVYPGQGHEATRGIPILDIESLHNVVAVDLLVHLVYRY